MEGAMLIRFRGDMIAVDPASEANSTAQNERRALLCYTGKFESMDGEVEITPDHLKRLVENHNARLKALGSAIKITDYPPVQLDHSTSAEHTVGRLVGPLELGSHDGQVAMFGHLRILGSDNLERVNDGRWSNLSIGADLESGELQEISITPFPAAKKACLLSAKFGGKMNPLCKFLMDTEELTEKEAMKRLEGMDDDAKAELSKKMKKRLSEEEDEKKTDMSSDEDEDKTNMSADEPEGEKLGDSKITIEHDADGDGEYQMSSDEDEDKTNMSAEDDDDDEDKDDEDKKEMKKHLSACSKRVKSVALAMRKAKIGNTLARLKAEGRICPAEIKKMDLTKLAAATNETVDAVLATYEAREPIVHMGQYGTLKGISAEELAKNARLAALEEETRANMASVSKNGGPKADTTRLSSHTSNVDRDEDLVDTDSMFPEMVKAIKAGDEKAARLMYGKALRSYRGDTAVSNDEMAHLMSAFAELESDFGNVVRLAGVRLGVKL
jgi:hypothetical protein